MRVSMLATVLVCAACAEEAPRAPEALRGVQSPPVNQPLVRPSGREIQQTRPSLPQDDRPALIVTRGGRGFFGELILEGGLSVSEDGIVVTPRDGDPVEILYRLPRGIPAPSQLPGTGQVVLRDRGGPDGADRVVIVGDGRAVILAEVWQTATEPQDVALTGGLRLVQRQVADSGVGYILSDLVVVENGRELGIVPVDSATAFSTGTGEIVVYVEVSHLYRVPADEDHAGSHYIMHAWIAGVRE